MPAAVGVAVLGELGLESAALTEAFFGANAAITVGYVALSSSSLGLSIATLAEEVPAHDCAERDPAA